MAHEGARRVANRGGAHRALQHGGEEGAEELVRDGPQLLFALLRFLCRPGRWSTRLKLQRPPEGSAQVDGNVAKIDLAARGVDGALVHFNAPSWAVRAVMSSTTLPVCPKTGSTSPSLTVHLCLHTAPGNRECAPCGSPTCRCHQDPDARHGPYHYWTRKARGKTVGLKLTADELGLYREWIENNRELERLVKEMRRISSRVLALITGRQAP